jgi:hypothetical protein
MGMNQAGGRRQKSDAFDSFGVGNDSSGNESPRIWSGGYSGWTLRVRKWIPAVADKYHASLHKRDGCDTEITPK